MNDTIAALSLQQIPDIGPSTAKRLIDVFGLPSGVFQAPVNDLMRVDGLGYKRAEQVKNFDNWGIAEGILKECERKGIALTHYGDRRYPELLCQISDPPTVLYYKGTLDPMDKYSLSVVGARAATSYGKSVARYLAEGLASMGFTIVSGMARGIDSVSHVSALKKGARTIAVLGSGIDVIYPPENYSLSERIQGAGSVISEFPLGTDPNKENFPRRNRLISGFSLGLVVVEAAKGSGTLITAKAALEQGREVFAVPGNITSPSSSGTNALLKGGAKMVTSPDDVVRELSPVLKGFIKAEKQKAVDISAEEREICDILSGEPVHIDEITRRAGCPSSKVLGLLLSLELKSVVGQMEGKKFYLIQEEQRV